MSTAVVVQRDSFACIPILLYVCLALETTNNSGVAQWLACWAHDPKVRGSKPRSASLRPTGMPSLRSLSPPLLSLSLFLRPACCRGVIPQHHAPQGHELYPATLAHHISAYLLLVHGRPLGSATLVFAALVFATSLDGSVVGRQSFKLTVLGSMPSGG